MILNLPQVNPYLFLSLVLGALLFGLAFNWLTGYLSRRGYTEGYTWALVGFGTLITLVISGFVIGVVNVAVVLVFFVVTGVPMAIGSWWRTATKRRDEMERE